MTPIINLFKYFASLLLKALLYNFALYGIISLFFVAYNKSFLKNHLNVYGSYLQQIDVSLSIERVLSEMEMLQIYTVLTFYFLIITLFFIDFTSGKIIKEIKGKRRIVFSAVILLGVTLISSCSPSIEYPQQLLYKDKPLISAITTFDTVYSSNPKIEYTLPLKVLNKPYLVVSPGYGSMEILATKKGNKISGYDPIVLKVGNYGLYQITLSEEAFCKQRYSLGVWFIKSEPKDFL